jgi:hypothetical protein
MTRAEEVNRRAEKGREALTMEVRNMVAVGDGLVAWVVRRGVCCELSGTMGWSLGDESGWGARGLRHVM